MESIAGVLVRWQSVAASGSGRRHCVGSEVDALIMVAGRGYIVTKYISIAATEYRRTLVIVSWLRFDVPEACTKGTNNTIALAFRLVQE